MALRNHQQEREEQENRLRNLERDAASEPVTYDQGSTQPRKILDRPKAIDLDIGPRPPTPPKATKRAVKKDPAMEDLTGTIGDL